MYCHQVFHCFPWSRWYNNDLWNLLPVSEKANSNKSEKLPSATLMHQARHRILHWWEEAYMQCQLKPRFLMEAESALPLVDEGNENLEIIFDSMLHQRARLKANQQLVEWG